MQESFPVSNRVDALVISGIKEMAMRAARIPNVASLAWGLPSFRTPESVREAIKHQLDSDPDIGKYSLPDGLPELRAAAADDYERRTGVTVDADRNVVITAGNMQAINALLHTVIDPGDEVIITDPGFSSHIQQIRLCNGIPVGWRLDEATGWALDVESLPGLLTARTRALLLVTPSNPTGAVFSRPDLERIAALVQHHNLLLIVDDPYRHFLYEDGDGRYCNPASIAGFGDRIAYCFTFSKAFAMSGWRLGYMIVSEELKRQILKVHDATLICAPRVSQAAAYAALTGNQAYIAEFTRILADRRTLICERLDRVRHVFSYVPPRGAYYVFPRIEIAHESARAFAIDLLEQAGVCVTPGDAFGAAGEHHVRMAFCVSEAEISLAFDRIESRYGGPSG